MKLLRPMSFLFLVGLAAGVGTFACAQESDPTQIYLDEPEKEPPPTIVRQDTQKENYDTETRRLERDVAFLSNDQVVNHGKYVEYYRDGTKYSEGVYKMGLYVGQWQFWHPNGKLCKSVGFKAGKPDGHWDVFRPDGSREASKSYKNGLRHGPWIVYFEDGEQPKMKFTYNQGKIEGERLIYFANGQMRQQVPFENGLMHGTITNWNEEGKKVSEMQFENGKPIGRPKLFEVTSEAQVTNSK